MIPVPEQEPKKRIGNFDEVCLGYSEEDALREAQRCLQCRDARCVKKCPVYVAIPEFIAAIRKKDYDSALEIIRKTNQLPGICGRVCPQEKQCEFGCILNLKSEAISVGKLERFAADHGSVARHRRIKPDKSRKKSHFKIAVVGSGPAGLAAATLLNRMGHDVTLFEALHAPGGVLTYGIPEFRLPRKIVEAEISEIRCEGVEIRTNSLIGSTITLAELRERFNAVFLGTGAGLPYFMNIPGEDLIGVYSANEYLTRINLMKAASFPKKATPVLRGKKTIVVGCGNVAIDSARTAKRLGSEVTVVYRRTLMEAPARQEEIRHAQEEGVHFLFLTAPKRILGDKRVEGVELIQMMQSNEDESGRRRSVALENSEFTMACDQMIVAIGQGPNPLLIRSAELEVDDFGKLKVNKEMMTGMDGVFAGGDIVEGEATVIKAMGDGKLAAMAIDKYLLDNRTTRKTRGSK